MVKRMRILLAEDEIALAKALSTIFSKNNYSIDVAYDGEEAFDYIQTGIYDLAILDVMMPKMDGITLLKKVRASKNNMPIIMLTAKDEISDIELGLDSGADDYLTKPFAVKELLARVRALSRRVENQSVISNELVFEDLKLSITDFTLSSENGSVRLSNKEFQMLEMLMSAPGKVISTEKFMDKIWGYDSDTEIGVVWVYIAYLRKKIANLSSLVEIKAMRNSGYYIGKKND